MHKASPKIIVVGAGAAGMSAALAAVEEGASVTLLSLAEPFRASSARLREGIAAALDTAGEGDTAAMHAAETLRCGDYLAHEKRVKGMCDAAPGIVELLARMGVGFDRTAEGAIRLGKCGGATKRRLARAGRSTGVQVLTALAGQILHAQSAERVHVMPGWEFISLIIDDSGACRGVVAQNLRNMEIRPLAADAVIICAGGYPALLAKHAASVESDGAAIAACYAQGAAVANPEFVQFSPYAIDAAGKLRALPESSLAEGGSVWVERDGRPWHVLEEFFHESSGLVPRDIATRALWKAVRDAALTPDSRANAFVDITQLDPDAAAQLVAPFLDACDALAELDALREPVRIEPAVFATMGGLWVDARHASNIPGLFAAGGSACQYHGACIMAGNELLASIYGGMVAGRYAACTAERSGRAADSVSSDLMNAAKGREEDVVAHIAAQEGSENAHLIGRELGELLVESVWLEKDNAVLKKALEKIDELGSRFSKAQLPDRAEWANAELPFMRRMRRRFDLARLIVAASLGRDESRGAHFKPALPLRDDAKWHCITRGTWSASGPVLDFSERVEIEAELQKREY